jgi:hypothetical protein
MISSNVPFLTGTRWTYLSVLSTVFKIGVPSLTIYSRTGLTTMSFIFDKCVLTLTVMRWTYLTGKHLSDVHHIQQTCPHFDLDNRDTFAKQMAKSFSCPPYLIYKSSFWPWSGGHLEKIWLSHKNVHHFRQMRPHFDPDLEDNLDKIWLSQKFEWPKKKGGTGMSSFFCLVDRKRWTPLSPHTPPSSSFLFKF